MLFIILMILKPLKALTGVGEATPGGNATWAFLPEINVDKNSPIPNGGGSTTFRMQYAMRR